MSKRKQKWQCITGCGACCRLSPAERPEAIEALSAEQKKIYLQMVNNNGWCNYYDTGKQCCKIYAERPDFCNVLTLSTLFEVPNEEFDSFLISCCRQQIRSRYGGKSKVLRRFNKSVSNNS